MAIIDFRKYPFLKPLEEELKKYAGGVTLNDLLSSGSYYLEEAKKRIDKIIKDEELEPYEKIKDSVLVFYTTLYLVAALGNETLKRKFIERETSIWEEELKKENDEVVLEILKNIEININSDTLDIKFKNGKKIMTITYKFSMNFIDYLKITRGLRKLDPSFSLSTHILKDGKIYLKKEEVAKILAYKIKENLEEMTEISEDTIPEQIKKYAEEIKGKKTPPCIKALIDKKSLTDIEKQILITYFIDIGLDENTILGKFNDESTKELIKKFKGDKKTKYIIYSCNKMRELNLCVANCNVLNPLQLYYGKLE